MAYEPPTIKGKLATSATDQNALTVNETLGYINIDVFDATNKTKVQQLANFGRAINLLTTNTFAKASVTYEARIDNLDFNN